MFSSHKSYGCTKLIKMVTKCNFGQYEGLGKTTASRAFMAVLAVVESLMCR